ncbi:hypothetical protein KIN20_001837 [Parelaphostrongylus tenuis]|uniref:Uncharacterized protein n=1 Tax=Parelaphostrongylus tenuis TaxID=148309 RepID=A0AAD5MDE5_PARTN|nr:hypothetical protein KIN20_001837 [Parelaphostrongylus tenuis]
MRHYSRAFLHVGAGWYRPDPKDVDNSSIYEHLVCMDLKGMLLKAAADQAISRLVLNDMESNSNQRAKDCRSYEQDSKESA